MDHALHQGNGSEDQKFTIESAPLSQIRRHCLGLLPLEAYGILLGHKSMNLAITALPVSHTRVRFATDDRLALIPSALPSALELAGLLGLEYLGVYQAESVDWFRNEVDQPYVSTEMRLKELGIPGVCFEVALPGGEWRLFQNYVRIPSSPPRRLIQVSKRIPECRRIYNQKKILRRWKAMWPPAPS